MASVEEGPAFTQAILSVVVISVVPTLVLFCLPVAWLNKSIGGLNLQRALLAFAAGGLLGDVFLHAIPHLLAHDHSHDHDHSEEHVDHLHEHEHDHEHEHEHDHSAEAAASSAGLLDVDVHAHAQPLLSASTQVGLSVLAGFLVFFMIEKLLTSCMLASNCFVKHQHGHGHSHDLSDADQSPTAKSGKSKRKNANAAGVAVAAADGSGAASPRGGHSHSHSHGGAGAALLGTGGWLNLVADFMHNFTDGIAIGAAFASDASLGMATTLSVFFHEIPHEIGDFTILLQNGFSKTKAIMAQFVTAGGALLGALVGLLAYRNPALEATLLALTAGGFVYVATVTVLPELLATPVKGTHGVIQALAEGVCFSLGVALMVLVAIGEEHSH